MNRCDIRSKDNRPKNYFIICTLIYEISEIIRNGNWKTPWRLCTFTSQEL